MIFALGEWLLPLVGVGLLAALLHGAVKRRRPTAAIDAPPPSATAVSQPIRSPREDLEAALAIHHTVDSAWAAYALDPHAVLDRPALSDVRDPLTQGFLHAREEAAARRPEPGTRLPAHRIPGYVEAVALLADAWDAADRHARELGVSEMSDQERNAVRRAHLALDRVLDHRTPAAERAAAYRLVSELLAGIVTLPDLGQRRLQKMIGPGPDEPEDRGLTGSPAPDLR